ncbi:MAG TPA: acyltransferase family protein [Rubrobacteraceae bacterium]|nr:acyltransferase family protein [Rubrobacteraceae bacterium]
MTSTIDKSSRQPDRSPPKSHFRPDVEGLRAVAVVAVLLYHASIPFTPGGYVGVDVFFVISGFLITGLIVAEIERTGTVSLFRFYSRRAKRLLPLTVVVLGTVVVVSWLLFDPVRMDKVSFDVVASGLYVMNWLLAVQAADYFGAGLQASPVQHFWTLAVEEQFYLLWPTLLLFVAWWCRRTRRSLRPVLVLVLATVAVSSLAYSVYSTVHEAGAAYFSTLTRAWEFMLGGALALVPASRLKLPRPVAAVLATAGLGAIVFSTVRFSDDTLFPGYAALVPTLGTAAIIAAGFASTSAMPVRLLTLAPVRHVGRISYSWYLWHWPPLVFAAAIWGKLSALEGVAVLCVSYVPAVLTYRWIERPFHHSRTLTLYPRKALALGGACTVSSIAMGLVLLAVTPTVPKPPESEVAGASVMIEGDRSLQKSADAVHPSPREAEKQRSEMYDDGCHLDRPEEESPECVYGNPDSKTTVVLFGDSHAMHWFPALNRLAKERDWRLVGLSKSACPPADVQRYSGALSREYSECEEWRERTLERIVEKERPNLVVTSMLNPYRVMEDGERLGREPSEKALQEGYVSTLKKLRATGAEVAVIRDIPHPKKDIPECVSRSLDDLQDCAIPRDEALDHPPINVRAAEELEDVHLIDATPVLCLEKLCPAVIGDVLVYRNGAHLTPTYARSLAPWLGERLPAPSGS